MSLPYEISVQEVKALVDSGGKVELIDVREMHEHALTRIEGADLIPMNTVPQRVQELESRAENAVLVVFCHHGMRSMSVVDWLRRQGVEQCQSMAGGIDAWSLRVDASVARY